MHILRGLCAAILAVFSICEPLYADASQSKKEWSSDLDVLLEEIEGRHSAPFHTVTRKTFVKNLNDIKRTAKNADPRATVMQVAQLMASLGETHSYLSWPDGEAKIAFRRYPFSVAKFADGVFITTASVDYQHLIGAQILKFGDRDINDVLSDIALLTGADSQWTHDVIGPWRLSIADLMITIGAAMENGDVSVSARLGSGEIDTFIVSPVITTPSLDDTRDEPILQASLYWRDPKMPYWFSYIQSKDTLYFQFNSIRENKEDSIADFSKRLSDEINSNQPTRIIIDLRRNIGGNSKIARPIMREIISSKAAMRSGGIIVLISPSTISAAVVFAEELSHFAKTVFIGEPTGSNRNQWGDNTFFELPNSKLRVSVSTMFYQTGGPYVSEAPIYPSVYIPGPSSDYFEIKDSIIAEALSYASQPTVLEIYGQAESSGADVIGALRNFVSAPKRKFQDFERPLRRLAGKIGDDGDTEMALAMADILIARHPERARSYMAKGEQLEAMGDMSNALEYWRRARDAIASDPSLYPDLARRLTEYAESKISEIQEKGN